MPNCKSCCTKSLPACTPEQHETIGGTFQVSQVLPPVSEPSDALVEVTNVAFTKIRGNGHSSNANAVLNTSTAAAWTAGITAPAGDTKVVTVTANVTFDKPLAKVPSIILSIESDAQSIVQGPLKLNSLTGIVDDVSETGFLARFHADLIGTAAPAGAINAFIRGLLQPGEGNPIRFSYIAHA